MSSSLLASYLNANIRVLLHGRPGVAKTARLVAGGTAAGREVVVTRCSTADRTDFAGCLVPDVSAGLTRTLPLDLLARMRSTETPTLWILDDIRQAPADVQAAIFQLFDRPEHGGVSPAVLIAGTTNRAKDRAGAGTLNAALRSRFHAHLSIAAYSDESDDTASDTIYCAPYSCPDPARPCGQCELCGWLDWADANSAPPVILAWHRQTAGRTLAPEHDASTMADATCARPDFRAWETTIRLLTAGDPALSSYSAIAAVLGRAVAAEFSAYAALAADLPSLESILLDPTVAPVPTAPAPLYLSMYSLAHATTNATAAPLAQYMSRVPEVFAALWLRETHRRLGGSFLMDRDVQRLWRSYVADIMS